MTSPPCSQSTELRVAIVYKVRSPHLTSHVGLGITAGYTAKTLRRAGIWAEAWGVASAGDLSDRLTEAVDGARRRRVLEPTHVVVLAPWLATVQVAALARELPDTTFVIVSHSNFGFLGADPHAVKLLRELVDLQHGTHNVRVAGNAERFTSVAREIWSTDVALLPNLYDLSEPMPPARSCWPGDSLRLGLFGAGRLLKNGTTAAAAAARLAATLRVPTELFVSTDSSLGGIPAPVRELVERVPNLRLVDAGWLSWPAFRRQAGHMHVLLQPSFSESFNNVTADGIWAGVPTAASTAIPWVPERWQANPDDAGDVARVADYLLHCPHAVDEGRRALERFVAAGLGHWRAFLSPPVARAA